MKLFFTIIILLLSTLAQGEEKPELFDPEINRAVDNLFGVEDLYGVEEAFRKKPPGHTTEDKDNYLEPMEEE